MAAGWIIGLLAGAPVVVHLTESANLPPEHPGTVVVALARAIERATEKTVVIDDLSRCADEAECVGEIGAQFGSSQVVLVRLVGAVRTGRALVALASPGKGTIRRVDLEYPIDGAGEWPAIFSGLAAILFPAELRREQQPVIVETAPPPIEERSIVGPVISWSAIGLGAALAATATGLRVSANAARSDVESRPIDDPMRDQLIAGSNSRGLASNLLFGAAAVAVVSGAVYLLTH